MFRSIIFILCIFLCLPNIAFASKQKSSLSKTVSKSSTKSVGTISTTKTSPSKTTVSRTATKGLKSPSVAKSGLTSVVIENIQIAGPTTDCQYTWKVWIRNNGSSTLSNLVVNAYVGTPWAGASGKPVNTLAPNQRVMLESKFTRNPGTSKLKVDVTKNNIKLVSKTKMMYKAASPRGEITKMSVQANKWTVTLRNRGKNSLCDTKIQCSKAKSSDSSPSYIGSGGAMVEGIGVGQVKERSAGMNAASTFSQGFDIYKFQFIHVPTNKILDEKIKDLSLRATAASKALQATAIGTKTSSAARRTKQKSPKSSTKKGPMDRSSSSNSSPAVVKQAETIVGPRSKELLSKVIVGESSDTGPPEGPDTATIGSIPGVISTLTFTNLTGSTYYWNATLNNQSGGNIPMIMIIPSKKVSGAWVPAGNPITQNNLSQGPHNLFQAFDGASATQFKFDLLSKVANSSPYVLVDSKIVLFDPVTGSSVADNIIFNSMNIEPVDCRYRWNAQISNTGNIPFNQQISISAMQLINGNWSQQGGTIIPSLNANSTKHKSLTFWPQDGATEFKVILVSAGQTIKESQIIPLSTFAFSGTISNVSFSDLGGIVNWSASFVNNSSVQICTVKVKTYHRSSGGQWAQASTDQSLGTLAAGANQNISGVFSPGNSTEFKIVVECKMGEQSIGGYAINDELVVWQGNI